MIHFNIGKKIEINPFEDVQFVTLSDGSFKLDYLRRFLNKATKVSTRKINGDWTIMYDVTLLDFVTLMKWIAPYRGIFYYKGRSIHFIIQDDIMSCW